MTILFQEIKTDIKNPGVYIKISDKIATFAYKEFFEGYATRRRIMQ